nr:exodeoxyribonuclease YycJ-like [Nerophis lumbriciformis]
MADRIDLKVMSHKRTEAYAMKVIPLQSGSKGNCFYVESDNTRLLVDAGISLRQASLRLESQGRDISQVQGILLTHDHSDHCKYVADFSRRLKIPVHLTRKTLNALGRSKARSKTRTGELENSVCFQAGQSQTIGEIKVDSVPTPHDAVDGVAYVLEYAGHRVGILTDLGHAFDGLREVLRSLDAVIIESNYDEQLLQSSPYPEFLKRRIRGRGGHLSNQDSARLVHQSATSKLQWVCLCHLSEENNCPDSAIRAHQNWLGEDFPIYVANRDRVSDVLEVRNG